MKRIIMITVVMLLATLSSASAFADNSRFVFSRKTVEDKRTGLTWTRTADLAKLDWIEASDLVKKLNKREYAGFQDWRLPNKDELYTLVTYAMRANYFGGEDAFSPYQLFNQLGFNDVQNYWYWTASHYEGNTSYIWVISMYNGKARGENQYSKSYVWPVRGGK
ncbi:MAG: DUF1566 domain-containing protein [Desulfuromonadaceae bacterium]|nr:DUF1566 domain-containing protein [Desulfuromonadaceae bacterium]